MPTFSALVGIYDIGSKWLNENQGVLSVTLFLTTLLLGWVSGIFSALRRRPNFTIRLTPGPTFCCTFETGAEHKGHPVHRTGIALYLHVANIGSAPSSIESISVGYRNAMRPPWWPFRTGWVWLTDQMAIIHDFQSKIGENIKFYPFLVQRSMISGKAANTYLKPGQSTNGVVYFEQLDSWGSLFPRETAKGVRIKVILTDVLGRSHSTKFYIEAVNLETAREYNPSFGKTIAELNHETLPHDREDVS